MKSYDRQFSLFFIKFNQKKHQPRVLSDWSTALILKKVYSSRSAMLSDIFPSFEVLSSLMFESEIECQICDVWLNVAVLNK